MREPQFQGVHPAQSCHLMHDIRELQVVHPAHSHHLMHDIREQRICKSKAVGRCGPCLVLGKAVSLYLSIKAGGLLFIMHSSHQDITGHTHSSADPLLLLYASTLERFLHAEYLRRVSFARLWPEYQHLCFLLREKSLPEDVCNLIVRKSRAEWLSCTGVPPNLVEQREDRNIAVVATNRRKSLSQIWRYGRLTYLALCLHVPGIRLQWGSPSTRSC